MSKRSVAKIGALTLAVLSLAPFTAPRSFGETPTTRPMAKLVAPATGEALTPDARNITGVFDNGLKYVIRPHSNPPGRVWFYLRVDTGALNETEPQNGLAHFIEHMAFNGSKNFKAGELIPLLNSLGMQFGLHTNAHTNHTETVYKLQMPDAEPKTVETALKIFTDYADGLLFDDKEIEDERGVVIEEWRSGKSVGERNQKKLLKGLFPQSRINVHDVIGTDTNLAKVSRQEFLDYWNTWYRPERMTLVIVGDFKPDQIESLLVEPARKTLGSFQGRAPAREPGRAMMGELKETKVLVVTDPEQVSADVTILATTGFRPPVTTYEGYERELVEGVGEWIVNRRLGDLQQKGKAAYQGAGVGSLNLFKEVRLVTGSAQGQPEDWNKMLDQVIEEVQRAVQHGFTARELELAKTAILSGAERGVETEPTVDAQGIVAGITESIDEGVPVLSAATRLEITKRALAGLKVEAVNEAFKAAYAGAKYSYVVTLPESKAGFTLPTNDVILAAADAAWARPVVANLDDAAGSSLLAADPVPGAIATQTADETLKVTTIVFENGVVFHHRFMDYKKDQVSVRVTMPGGIVTEAGDTIGLSAVANAALAQPATSRLTSTQVRDLMIGKKVSVGGGFALDALAFRVAGSPADLETGMQLLNALITDAKLEQAAFDEWKKAALLNYDESLKGLEGMFARTMQKTLYAGDPRLQSMTPDVINRMKPEAAEAWLKATTSSAAIEVAVVGDIKLEAATALVAKYLGSLPKRTQDFTAIDGARKLDLPNAPRIAEASADVIAPKAIALAGFQGAEADNVADIRKLNLVASILSERMIKQLREKERLVYSIGASSNPGRGMPGMGMFIAAAPVDPQNAGKLADQIVAMMKEFAKTGPTESEMVTVRKQWAKELETNMKEPSFWLGQIADMTYRKRSLDVVKQLPEAYQTYTADELRETAAMYFQDDTKMIRIIVTPKPANPLTTSPLPTTVPSK